MLQVDLRELARGPVETQGQLAGNDPLFEGLDVVLAEPVRVAGRLHAAGEGRFYWRGSLTTRLAGQCRRCLVPVPVPVVATDRKSTRLNSSHGYISYAVFCLKKKNIAVVDLPHVVTSTCDLTSMS